MLSSAHGWVNSAPAADRSQILFRYQDGILSGADAVPKGYPTRQQILW